MVRIKLELSSIGILALHLQTAHEASLLPALRSSNR